MSARPIALASILAFALAAPASTYQITGTASNPVAGHLVRTEHTVQAGPGAIDRFKMIRLAKDVPPSHLKGVVLLLPPLGLNFAFYEQRDEDGAPGSSIAEFFAVRGYDVWGYSPRFEGVPAGTCEAGIVDCSPMAGWDLQSMVDDIAFVRSQIEATRPGVEVVAGGASLGGILALAVANAAPGDYVGIFPWEGMLASDDPTVHTMNQSYCAGLTAQLAAGVIFDGVTGSVFRHVAGHAANAPAGLTPIPLFPPTATNQQVLLLALSVSTPGPVSMPVPDYIFLAGNLAQSRFRFASEERLFENVTRFNSYVPLATVKNVSCGLAGVETQHVANLGQFTGSVLGIGGGRGFGPYMQYHLDLTGSNDVRLLNTPAFGHIDHFMTRDHRDFVERPILHWLRRVMD